MISLESYCTIRVALAEKMLRDSDPRLRDAFNELRREMFKANESASATPRLTRQQA